MDFLAKEGARGEHHANNISFREKKTFIRALTIPRSQRDDYHLLSRKQQVVLMRLRTGHNRLNSHMHGKQKLAQSPTCPVIKKTKLQSTFYKDAPFTKLQEKMFGLSTPLTTKLYGCKHGLQKTTSFISRAALIV